MIDLEPMPMQEAVDFWRNKILMAPSEYRTLTEEARLGAFAVSGIARGAELETVFNAISNAIENGTTLDDFKRECAEIFERRGWTGAGAWRIDNIFRTNIQQAYNVGRYRQMMEFAEDRPYWMYDAVNDSRTRPAHRAMDGRVFRYDHPVWDIWYPLNGYRCRCTVTSLSESQMRRMGLTVEENDPTNTLVEITDPRTGRKLPAFQLIPDPGFSYNPGKSFWGGITPSEIPHIPSGGAVTDASTGLASSVLKPDIPIIDVVRNRPVPQITESMLLPAGMEPEFYVSRFLQEFGVDDINGGTTVKIPGANIIVPVNRYLFIDKRDMSWKVMKEGRERYMIPLAQTILDPLEVWYSLPEPDRKYPKLRLVKIFQENRKTAGFCVFSMTRDGWMATTAFIPKAGEHESVLFEYLDKYRSNSKLLYRKE